jgi:FKBP-type peptidyl-prolyl cis-trans isomerase FkpA/FKBP-type peptidyl-prolyl cis-trans isomerase FklB
MLAATLMAVAACTPDRPSTGEPQASADREPTTDEEKAFYTLGSRLSQQVALFHLSDQELAMVKEGFSDAVLNRPLKIDPKQSETKLQEIARARMTTAAAEQKRAGQDFLDKAAAEKGAVKTASGLVIQEITPGTGSSPQASDKVKVHYHGTLTDGTIFDSSVQRGQPATFPLNGVIKCWTEGVQLMKVGGKSKLFCPAELAYGDRGAPPLIKPGATLVFEVELLEIVS